MLSYYQELKYLKNEFEEAHWDPKSGMDADTLTCEFRRYLAENREMPLPLLRANAFAFIVDHAQIEINPHNIFADKINIGIKYDDRNADRSFLKKHLHEAGPDIMENQMYYPLNRSVQKELVPDIYERNERNIRLGIARSFFDSRHTCPDWNNVFALGISGLLDRLKQEKASKETLTADQEIFYDAAIICYEAILRYMDRIYQASLEYDIPEFSECILHLRRNPPATFYQAMEFTILFTVMAEIGYEKVRTLGLIDQLYWPFYQNDIAEGRYTRDEMRDMTRFFLRRWNAFRRGAQQPFGLGGSHRDGSDAVNEITYMVLEVYEELDIIDPKIHICIGKNTDKKLLIRAVEMIRNGCGNIVLINDDAMHRAYEKMGIPHEDALDYLPMGCYEPFLMGKEAMMNCASWMNMSKSIEFALYNGSDPMTHTQVGPQTGWDFASYEDFEAAFFEQLRCETEDIIGIIESLNAIGMKINPSPLLSATMTSCVEQGRDMFDGGLLYNNTTIKCFGIATTVDSLLAVKKLVYDEKLVTLDELRTALDQDWNGYEWLRAKVLNDSQKYGNNLPIPDALMCKIYRFLKDLFVMRPNNRGGVYRMGSDSVDFALADGAHMGATPDGRRRGKPISKNLCASSGMQKRGILAFMQSLLKLDQADIMGSAPLDFMVHPSAVRGDAGLEAMADLLRTYFDRGGMTIHGNIVKAEDLKAAKAAPEKYRDLQVRVCGWNDYFVNLSSDQQDEFIAQAEVL